MITVGIMICYLVGVTAAFFLGMTVYKQGRQDRERKEAGLPPEPVLKLPERQRKPEKKKEDDLFEAIDRFGEDLRRGN